MVGELENLALANYSQYLSLLLILALELVVLERHQNDCSHFMDTFKFRVMICLQRKTIYFYRVLVHFFTDHSWLIEDY